MGKFCKCIKHQYLLIELISMTTFLKAQWRNLIMANYEVAPALLQPYLPKGLELDYYNGKCYVSLVGFLFQDTSLFHIPVPFWGNFEEVNLRFYVIHKTANESKRGVVFINETVPNNIVAYVANKLYKEHYTAVPTRHTWEINALEKQIEYQWCSHKNWYSIKVIANAKSLPMQAGSLEAFIFEHYFGYTKVNEHKTIEYKVAHPSWEINHVKDYAIKCDFAQFYGSNFEILNHTKPSSVMLAEGSSVSVEWKRNEI